MLKVLDEHHLCNVERPAEFGKTKMFMQYAKEHPGDKVLYIYDVSSVPTSIEHDYKPENVQFLSYAMLSRKAAADNVRNILLNIDYKAVIFDESHLLGGENISKLALEVIPEIVKQGRYVIGGTATPTRTDLINVTKRFFWRTPHPALYLRGSFRRWYHHRSSLDRYALLTASYQS